jgi:nicotinate-nucleotide pyrophosphorylase (carboxylating)
MTPSELGASDVVQLGLDVLQALAEDLGDGDVSAALIPAERKAHARIITREACVLAGRPWAAYALQALDPAMQLQWSAADGDAVTAGATLCRMSGNARALLSAERTALNFLQTLSATATHTQRLAGLIGHTKTRLLDTRKTVPGLRLAQKYAVRVGGGHNHRMGLFDAYLIKENHLLAAGSIASAVAAARAQRPDLLLQVEVESFEQVAQCVALGVPRVLLDNFSPQQAREMVQQYAGRIELEASGGIDDTSLIAYAEAGVDFISIGALTKHVRAIDLSMRIELDS